jgi:hypothetical protein
MRREKKRLEDEQRYFAARDLLREKHQRQKNSDSLLLSGVGGGESGGRGFAVSSGPRSPVNSSSGDRQFNLRLQQLVALNALNKGGSNG